MTADLVPFTGAVNARPQIFAFPAFPPNGAVIAVILEGARNILSAGGVLERGFGQPGQSSSAIIRS
jgi:hypothetical protein